MCGFDKMFGSLTLSPIQTAINEAKRMAQRHFEAGGTVRSANDGEDVDGFVLPSSSGEGRLANGGKMGDADVELELVIAQDRCLTDRLRFWGGLNGGAGSVSIRNWPCYRKRQRRALTCQQWRAAMVCCRRRCISGAGWPSSVLSACRGPRSCHLSWRLRSPRRSCRCRC